MYRLFFLTTLSFTSYSLAGQGVGEFQNLTNSFKSVDEQTYSRYIKAAREDGDSVKVVLIKSLQGRQLMYQQRYLEAEKLLFESLRIITKMKGKIHSSIKLVGPSIYDTYDYIGEYYTQTGDYKKAEFFLKQSEEARTMDFSRGSIHRIVNIQNLVDFYLNTKQNEKAEIYLNKLNRELNRTRFNNGNLKAAYETYYNGMTEISIRFGRLNEARHFYKKVIQFYGGTLTFSYSNAAARVEFSNIKAIYFRSQIYLMEGNVDAALKMVQGAIPKQTDSLKHLPDLLRTQSICLYRQNKIREALESAHALLYVHLHNIKKVFNSLSEEEKETMFNRVKDDFDLFNSLIIMAASGKSIDEGYLESLLNFRLQTKALLLNNSLKIRQAIFASRDSALISNYQKLILLKNKTAQESFSKKKGKEGRLLGQLAEEIKVLEKTVSRQVTSLANSFDRQTNARDVQAHLGMKEAAIEMLRVRKLGIKSRIKENNQPVYALTDTILYLALTITSARIDYAMVKNGNLLEERYIKLFKNQVRLVSSDTVLYHFFWSPIGQKLNGYKTLYFSGDGVYNQINVNLLQNKEGNLGDQYKMVLLGNLKELVKDEIEIAEGTAVFFGNPDFQYSKVESQSDQTRERDVRNVRMDDMKEINFNELPGTKTEIENGSRILTSAGWNIQTFLGNQALENSLKSIRNPQLLHIATHGFFVEGEGINPMLRSGLIFSGIKSETDIAGEDGVLTAYEASSLTLDSTRLVVLSACETGSGEVRTGEGVYGLQRAFLIAGARNIIMSLWKVDDKATQQLMTLFYENLSKVKNVRTAFSAAQKTLRTEYPEPFYWGAFVLIGK